MVANHVFVFIFPGSIPTFDSDDRTLLKLEAGIGKFDSYGRIVRTNLIVAKKLINE